MATSSLAPEQRTMRDEPHDRRRIVFAVGGLYTEGSGVARIVCDLANAMARNGGVVDVCAPSCPGREATDALLDAPNRLQTAPGQWWGRLAHSPQLRSMLDGLVPGAEVVHNHSLWMLPNSYAARAGYRHDVPVMYTAHGFLEPWALSRSRWKKRLIGWAFQNADLRRAACIHVNSESELAGIRAYGLTNPVAIIPNGVEVPSPEEIPPRSVFEERCPEVRSKRVCLFLSRLHKKKGLKHLIEAWANLHKSFGDWHLVIAGPDDGYELPVREQIRTLGLANSVSLTGPLYGGDKLAALGAAELFVLPSFSEGFPMAVLEAMAAGLPVLMTPGCNFHEAADAGAAIEVSPDVSGTTEGLRQLLSLSETERREMGSTARALIESEYTWDGVARQLLEVYAWLGGNGDRPRTVVMR